MEHRLIHNINYEKVRLMEKPTILMNTDDLKELKEEIESRVFGFDIGDSMPTTYSGIPIKSSDVIQQGELVIYDDIFKLWNR